MSVTALSNRADRVRRQTESYVNEEIDLRSCENIEPFVGEGFAAISARIVQLEREWDVERWLGTNAATAALTGLVLGVIANRKWLIIPGIVLGFLLQHAVQGWCPPVELLRRWGIRTREEIDCEKFALKALRGDFADGTIRSASSAFAAAEA